MPIYGESIATAGIEWDDGNREKCCKHGLSIADVERVLLEQETLIVPAARNPETEGRYIAIGRSAAGRYAFVVFTPRRYGSEIWLRPISARYMHRKEIGKYAQEIAGPKDG
jgi:uncharacterized DUF497 family protein